MLLKWMKCYEIWKLFKQSSIFKLITLLRFSVQNYYCWFLSYSLFCYCIIAHNQNPQTKYFLVWDQCGLICCHVETSRRNKVGSQYAEPAPMDMVGSCCLSVTKTREILINANDETYFHNLISKQLAKYHILC